MSGQLTQEFSYTLIGGETHQVRSTAGDLVRLHQWAGDVDGNNPAHHAYLIWKAANRTGVFTDDFESFLDRLEDYEAVAVPKAPSKKQSQASSQ